MGKKWNRSLGTSKKEQGIYTPKAPQNQSNKPFKQVDTAPQSLEEFHQKYGDLK